MCSDGAPHGAGLVSKYAMHEAPLMDYLRCGGLNRNKRVAGPQCCRHYCGTGAYVKASSWLERAW